MHSDRSDYLIYRFDYCISRLNWKMFSIAEKKNFIKIRYEKRSRIEKRPGNAVTVTRIFSNFDRYKNSGTEHDNP